MATVSVAVKLERGAIMGGASFNRAQKLIDTAGEVFGLLTLA